MAYIGVLVSKMGHAEMDQSEGCVIQRWVSQRDAACRDGSVREMRHIKMGLKERSGIQRWVSQRDAADRDGSIREMGIQ